MIIQARNERFEQVMFSDYRLVNAQWLFCLCSMCSKSDIVPGVICPKHEKFMQETQKLGLAAPVFACADFTEAPNSPSYLDMFSTGVPRAAIVKAKEDWLAQLKLWERNGFKKGD